MNKLKCTMFGGKDGEQYNALMSAVYLASEAEDANDNEAIYNFLEEVPKTSVVCELIQALHQLGYKIVKNDISKSI